MKRFTKWSRYIDDLMYKYYCRACDICIHIKRRKIRNNFFKSIVVIIILAAILTIDFEDLFHLGKSRFINLAIKIFLIGIVVWALNPYKIVNRFFRTKELSPHTVFAYLGTACGAVLIIGNFTIFNNNYEAQLEALKIQNNALNIQTASLKYQQDYNRKYDQQQLYERFERAKERFLSNDPGKIAAGYFDIEDLLKAHCGNRDSLPDFFDQIPNTLIEFLRLHCNNDSNVSTQNYLTKYMEKTIHLVNYYTYSNIADYDLSGLNFRHLLIEFIDLENFCINNTTFQDITFFGSNIYQRDKIYSNVEFRNVVFKHSYFECLVFENSKFINCVFDGIYMDNVCFKNCILNNIRFINTDDDSYFHTDQNELDSVRFDNSILKNIQIRDCSIRWLDLHSAKKIEEPFVCSKTNVDNIPLKTLIKDSYKLTTPLTEDVEDNSEVTSTHHTINQSDGELIIKNSNAYIPGQHNYSKKGLYVYLSLATIILIILFIRYSKRRNKSDE